MHAALATTICLTTGALAATLLVAATQPTPAPAPGPGAPQSVDDKLKHAAREFTTWKRVSDQAHMAPQDCRMPVPAGALMSESTDDGTHGRKLYFLYLKLPHDPAALNYDYATAFAPAPGKPPAQPVGQMLVKQSFKAVEVDPKTVPNIHVEGQPGSREHPPEYLVGNDKAWRTGDPSGLFVMMKLDPATPDTDQGWVYATLEPDGSKVIQSGRLASCIKCHENAEHDRVFGQPRARQDREAARRRQAAPPAAPAK